jgi:hypothetical protein
LIDDGRGGNRSALMLVMAPMSEAIRTIVDIDAPPSRVWRVITEFEQFGDWNPLMVRMSGERERGAALRMTIALGARRLPADATLLVCEPEVELRWRGPRSELLQRVFSGEHFFVLERRQDGTRLLHGEDFDGALAPLLWRYFEAPLREGYARMNEALKARAEAQDD